MNCPACSHPLTQIEIGSLCVDICRGGCGGIWFDTFELQQVDEPEEYVGEALVHVPRDPNVRVDPSRRKECPRCTQMKLKRRLYSPQIAIEVDECPACGGFWLDGGELEHIRLEKGRLEKAAKQPAGMTPEMIRALYRMRTAHRDRL
ncbi:MAG TPA: zf-TFIIB domain-containing protein [Verrucomicrobiae bacterium]|nr:zf-TFIIB domain-containing protein [Verrucomicrobiae bacterium]